MKTFKIALTITGLLFFASVQNAFSQTEISGTVVDNTGTPLPGVNIVVKDTTTIGTATDANGNYSLKVPDNKNVLIFSFVGFEKKEVPIGDRKVINVQLKKASQQLQNLVVIGYGSQTKEDMTGSISEVSSEEIENTTANSVQQTLQGRTAGVRVTSSSGVVGEGINVNIRGTSSLSAGNQPLYVIDGVIVATQSLSGPKSNPLASISMSNIQSISILKDASAAAIYGSRASNGVVIIKTKNGQAGETKFNVSYQASTSAPTNKIDLMNAQQYVRFFREAAIEGGKQDYKLNPNQWSSRKDAVNHYLNEFTSKMNSISSGNDWQNNPANYNWQNRAFQSGYSHNLEMSASGGNETTTFLAGANYSDKQGILFDNAYKKISGRLNLKHHASDKLDLGLRVNINRAENAQLDESSSFGGPLSALDQAPVTPFFADAKPSQTGYQKGESYNTQTLFPNPVDIIENTEHETRTFHTLGNANAEYNILPNLSFKTRFGMETVSQNEEIYRKPRLSYYTGAEGTGYNGWTRLQNYTSDNIFTYQNTFQNNQDLEVILGTSYNWVRKTAVSTEGENFPSKDFTNIENAATITGGSSSETNYRFMSYFTRANYEFDDRYLFKLSARVDGSSRFGKNNKYGFFPAASIGWTLSEEDFISNIDAISFLKLRASYGITGNADIDNFPSRGLYSGVSYAGTSALVPSQTPNPDLKWETTKQFNVGIDFGFFNQRISGTVDYYRKKTTNLLLAVDVPGITGFSSQLRNVGKLENQGIEFAIDAAIITGRFSWSSNFNVSFNRNKITDLNGQILKAQSYANRYVNRGFEGQPIGVFYANEYAGVNPKNGDALYYLNHQPNKQELNSKAVFKVDGMFDNRYVTTNSNLANRTIVGNPNPDFTGGFNNTFSYKGISLDVLFQFVYGNDIYNATNMLGPNYRNRVVRQLKKGWQKPGDITDVPEQRLGFDNGGTVKSSRYISDGSYLRLRKASLSYEIPTKILSKLDLRQAEIFVSGTNLLTFTEYAGFEYDPEHSLNFTGSNLSIGNAFFTPPQARTISAGINLKF